MHRTCMLHEWEGQNGRAAPTGRHESSIAGRPTTVHMVTYRVPWYETVQLTMVMVRIVADFMVVPLPWYGQGPATMVMVRAGGSYQTMV